MKLFKYPVLVFDNIIVLLDPVPLVSLSFCSRKTRERIKRVSFSVKDAWFGNVIQGEKGFFLEVKFPETSNSLFVDSASLTREGKREFKKFSIRIGDTPYICRYSDLEEHSLVIDCSGFKKTSIFFNYILDLVRTGITEITFDLRGIYNVKKFISDPCFLNVQNIDLEGENAPVKKVMELYDCFEKPVLQTIVNTHMKSISPTSKLLHSENLSINPSKFVSIEHLLNFNGKYIYLNYSSLREEQIVAFVKHWLDGNYPNLEGAFITTLIESAFEKEKVLDEFNTKRWNPAERAQNFIFKASYYRDRKKGFPKIDCSNGHDLERNDGLMATILFRGLDSYFNFFVWHNRFP